MLKIFSLDNILIRFLIELQSISSLQANFHNEIVPDFES